MSKHRSDTAPSAHADIGKHRALWLLSSLMLLALMVSIAAQSKADPNGWQANLNASIELLSDSGGIRTYRATVVNNGDDDAHGLHVYLFSGTYAFSAPTPSGLSGSCSTPTTSAGEYYSICTFSSGLPTTTGNNTVTFDFQVTAGSTIPVGVQAFSYVPDADSSNNALTGNNYDGGTL